MAEPGGVGAFAKDWACLYRDQLCAWDEGPGKGSGGSELHAALGLALQQAGVAGDVCGWAVRFNSRLSLTS